MLIHTFNCHTSRHRRKFNRIAHTNLIQPPTNQTPIWTSYRKIRITMYNTATKTKKIKTYQIDDPRQRHCVNIFSTTGDDLLQTLQVLLDGRPLSLERQRQYLLGSIPRGGSSALRLGRSLLALGRVLLVAIVGSWVVLGVRVLVRIGRRAFRSRRPLVVVVLLLGRALAGALLPRRRHSHASASQPGELVLRTIATWDPWSEAALLWWKAVAARVGVCAPCGPPCQTGRGLGRPNGGALGASAPHGARGVGAQHALSHQATPDSPEPPVCI